MYDKILCAFAYTHLRNIAEYDILYIRLCVETITNALGKQANKKSLLIWGKKEKAMERESNYNQLRYILEELYGEVLSLSEECPGVYYTSVKQNETDILPHEYYIVDKTTGAISSEAKAYGQPVDGQPDLLTYPMDKLDSGQKIIAYEVCRYKLRHKQSIDTQDSLHEMAVHFAEYHPDYFGLYPAPMLTPRGHMVRYRTLDNGIYLLETDTGEELVSFCFPLWKVLSTFAQKAGEYTDYDIQHGIDETKGYLFFSKAKSCIAFFELWAEHPSWADSPVYNFPAIMNALWENFPDYAVVYNLAEQKGLNGISGTLLDIIGEIDLSIRPEKMIALTPETGTDFIDVNHCMKQKGIEGYIEKFGTLLSSCTYTHKFYTTEIQPKYYDNPQLSEVWMRGAFNGIMIHFIRTLTDAESVINHMVLKEVACNLGGMDLPIDMNDYIDAALVVLERLGYHIPDQKDDTNL